MTKRKSERVFCFRFRRAVASAGNVASATQSTETTRFLLRRSNERRWALRKLICKIERHDDSKNNLLTRCISCSVRSPVSRPSPKLASSRLRQRLFWAAASQTSRRKPCYRQSALFSNSSWLYYFTHHVLQCRSSAHY